MKEQNFGEYTLTYFAGIGDGSSNICNMRSLRPPFTQYGNLPVAHSKTVSPRLQISAAYE